jgi:hypothetical protein
MNTTWTATFELIEKKNELESIVRESPLYLDMSLFEREDFLHSLVSILLR